INIEAGGGQNDTGTELLMPTQFGQAGLAHGVVQQIVGKTVGPLLDTPAPLAAHEGPQHAGFHPGAVAPAPECQQIQRQFPQFQAAPAARITQVAGDKRQKSVVTRQRYVQIEDYNALHGSRPSRRRFDRLCVAGISTRSGTRKTAYSTICGRVEPILAPNQPFRHTSCPKPKRPPPPSVARWPSVWAIHCAATSRWPATPAFASAARRR